MISTIENTRHSLQAATGVFICIVYFQAIAVVFPLSFSVKMCYDRENDCEVAIVDKLVRKIEIPLARQRIKNAGLYIVPEEKVEELSAIAADAYRDYPLHNWFTKGTYDPVASHLIMKTTLAAMQEDALIYADSEDLNGFAVWIPLGFTGSKTLPFLLNGGVKLLLHSGLGIIKKLLTYETFAMKLKKKYTGHVDWYLYNLSIKKSAQGQGIATKLLRPMLEFCDDEKIVTYLETNKESNVSLYEHFGFDLQETNLIPGSPVNHYSMVREPKERGETD